VCVNVLGLTFHVSVKINIFICFYVSPMYKYTYIVLHCKEMWFLLGEWGFLLGVFGDKPTKMPIASKIPSEYAPTTN